MTTNIEISSKLKDAVKVGPFGGRGGTDRDIDHSYKPRSLTKVEIWSSRDGARSGGVIKGIRFTSVDNNHRKLNFGVWGVAAGHHHQIEVKPGEYVKKIVGTVGTTTSGDGYISSLKVATNNEEYGPFGDPASGDAFSLLNTKVAAFFVRCNDHHLNAVGFYVLPRP